jgi:hypothetical protein
MDFEAVVKSLEALSAFYADAVGAFTDEEFREELALFGPDIGKVSRGRRRFKPPSCCGLLRVRSRVPGDLRQADTQPSFRRRQASL